MEGERKEGGGEGGREGGREGESTLLESSLMIRRTGVSPNVNMLRYMVLRLMP